jgi:hypothetical protein
VLAWLQQQFRPFKIALLNDRELAMLTNGNVVLYLEAEHAILGLVFDENASHVDFHSWLLKSG